MYCLSFVEVENNPRLLRPCWVPSQTINGQFPEPQYMPPQFPEPQYMQSWFPLSQYIPPLFWGINRIPTIDQSDYMDLDVRIERTMPEEEPEGLPQSSGQPEEVSSTKPDISQEALNPVLTLSLYTLLKEHPELFSGTRAEFTKTAMDQHQILGFYEGRFLYLKPDETLKVLKEKNEVESVQTVVYQRYLHSQEILQAEGSKKEKEFRYRKKLLIGKKRLAFWVIDHEVLEAYGKRETEHHTGEEEQGHDHLHS